MPIWPSKPDKLRLVHPLPFSGVIFREIALLATIPIFGQISAKKVQIIKHEWTPEIYKIKLHCIVIILYKMHTKNPKKTYPSQSRCHPLDAIRELKHATFLSTRTSTGSKPRPYRWRMIASAVVV